MNEKLFSQLKENNFKKLSILAELSVKIDELLKII